METFHPGDYKHLSWIPAMCSATMKTAKVDAVAENRSVGSAMLQLNTQKPHSFTMTLQEEHFNASKTHKTEHLNANKNA